MAVHAPGDEHYFLEIIPFPMYFNVISGEIELILLLSVYVF